jgi:hypothetical protein
MNKIFEGLKIDQVAKANEFIKDINEKDELQESVFTVSRLSCIALPLLFLALCKNKVKLCINKGLNLGCWLYIHTHLTNKMHIYLCFVKTKSTHMIYGNRSNTHACD